MSHEALLAGVEHDPRLVLHRLRGGHDAVSARLHPRCLWHAQPQPSGQKIRRRRGRLELAKEPRRLGGT
jgi:hypothetical protein